MEFPHVIPTAWKLTSSAHYSWEDTLHGTKSWSEFVTRLRRNNTEIRAFIPHAFRGIGSWKVATITDEGRVLVRTNPEDGEKIVYYGWGKYLGEQKFVHERTLVLSNFAPSWGLGSPDELKNLTL